MERLGVSLSLNTNALFAENGEARTWACGFRQSGSGGCASESDDSRGPAAEAAAGVAGGDGDSGGAGAEFMREYRITLLPSAAPGIYAIPIAATGTTSGLVHSAQLTLTVTP